MKLTIADLDFYIFEQDERSEHFPVPGWYWQEVRLPPSGPFDSANHALHDLVRALESGKCNPAARQSQ